MCNNTARWNGLLEVLTDLQYAALPPNDPGQMIKPSIFYRKFLLGGKCFATLYAQYFTVLMVGEIFEYLRQKKPVSTLKISFLNEIVVPGNPF